ncbi:MAG: NAD(P)/FAD-dependent oxidoreductase [Armatimonadota bacterium]
MRAQVQAQFTLVGSGPAGVAAAITAVRDGFPPEGITIIEKGRRHDDSRVSGFGGAGANSDGKLVFESDIGGELASYVGGDIAPLFADVEQLYLGFLPPEQGAHYRQIRERLRSERDYGPIERGCFRAGLQFVPAELVPLGTRTCWAIVDAWYEYLTAQGVTILLETEVERFLPDPAGGWCVQYVRGGEVGSLTTRWLLIAPGRSGHDFLVRALAENEIDAVHGPIDIGIRVETDARLAAPLTDRVYEFKLRGLIEGSHVRTFCVCPQGTVIAEQYDEEMVAVNGQTDPENPTGRTNFAVLHTVRLDEPCHRPNQFAEAYIRTASILGARNPIVQTWPKFAERRRSRHKDIETAFIQPTLTRALPGDIRLALNAKSCRVIEAFMHALDGPGLLEGLCSNRTLLYAPEAKLYTVRPALLSPCLESELPDLFFAGDGSGITRGLVQASASGVVVGREVARRAHEQTR